MLPADARKKGLPEYLGGSLWALVLLLVTLTACMPATPGQRSTLRPEVRAGLLGGVLDALACGGPLAMASIGGSPSSADYLAASTCFAERTVSRIATAVPHTPTVDHGRAVGRAAAAAERYRADPCPDTLTALEDAVAACEVGS